MAIKHATTKSSGDKGLASEWNDDHLLENISIEETSSDYGIGDTWDDLQGMSKTFTLATKSKVLILFNGTIENTDTGAFRFEDQVRIVIDSVLQDGTVKKFKPYGTVTDWQGGRWTLGTQHLVELDVGEHTIKIQAKCDVVFEHWYKEKSMIIIAI